MSATAELADADLGGAVASFGRPLATGRGGAKIAVEASAASPAAAIANLAGTASIEARDGSILGVNLEEALRRSRRRPIDVWRDMRLGGTAFDKLEVSLALADGRARVERGAMVSRGMTARLNGLIDLVAESWALRLTAVQTDAAGEVSQDAAHLTLDIRGPWSASKVRVIGAGGSTDKAGARAPSRRSRRGGRLVERSLIGDPATLITKGRALPDPRADWLASSAKLRVGDNTGVRPSRAGFAFENEAAVARRSVGEFFSWASRRGRKLAVDETGTPAVEFAMVFPIFLAIVLATLQAATIFLVKAFFESTAEEAARTILTNQVGSLTAAQFQTEICNELTALFDCSEVTVELEPLPAGTTNLASLLPTFDSSGNVVGSPTVDVGVNSAVPGTDMLLVVMYPWPVFGGPLGLNFANMGNGKMLMTSTQVFRVEPTVPAG
jgi:Flp pilus assembly protein TadG